MVHLRCAITFHIFQSQFYYYKDMYKCELLVVCVHILLQLSQSCLNVWICYLRDHQPSYSKLLQLSSPSGFGFKEGGLRFLFQQIIHLSYEVLNHWYIPPLLQHMASHMLRYSNSTSVSPNSSACTNRVKCNVLVTNAMIETRSINILIEYLLFQWFVNLWSKCDKYWYNLIWFRNDLSIFDQSVTNIDIIWYDFKIICQSLIKVWQILI